MRKNFKAITNDFLFKYLIGLVIALMLSLLIKYNTRFVSKKDDLNVFYNLKSKWADSVLNHMSLEEKIGQLVIFKQDTFNHFQIDSLEKWNTKFHLGGFFLQTDSSAKQVEWTNRLQSALGIPLFFGIQTQNASLSFLKDIFSFPSRNHLKCIKSDSLIFDYFKCLINHYKSVGINLAMISNLNLPDSLRLADTILLMKPLKLNEKISNLFYNHKLLYVNYNLHYDNNKYKLDKQAYNYYKNTLSSLISGYYCQGDYNQYSSQVEKIFSKKSTFKSLLITEISQNDYKNIDKILASSVDLLITSRKPSEIITLIKALLVSKKLAINKINEKVQKILLAKAWIKPEKLSLLHSESSLKVLNSFKNLTLSHKLTEYSLLVLRNEKNDIPVKELDSKSILSICIGNSTLPIFAEYMNKYSPVNSISFNPEKDNLKNLLYTIKFSNFIILALNSKQDTALINQMIRSNPANHFVIINFGNSEFSEKCHIYPTFIQVQGTTEYEQQLTAELIFGGIGATIINPKKSDAVLSIPPVRVRYVIPEDAGLSSRILKRIDTIAIEGVSLGAYPGCQVFIIKDGKVVVNKAYGNLTYENKQSVQLNDVYDLASVTKIASTTIAAMKLIDENKMTLDDNIGKYFKNTKINYTRIKTDTLLRIDTINKKHKNELAKIINRRDTIRINDSIVVTRDTVIRTATPKNNIFKTTIRELLIHQTGITPAMPIFKYIFYKQPYGTNGQKSGTFDSFLKESKQLENKYVNISKKEELASINSIVKEDPKVIFQKYYSNAYNKDSSALQIAENFYLRNKYVDTIWSDTKQLRVFNDKSFLYSDVNMILLQQTIDTINQMNINNYMYQTFYKPLGLKTIGYLPLKRFDKSHIVPSEDDKIWRDQVLHGYVHDPCAAMLGGIAGNAGLFSNAQDLGILFQMIMNKGSYGGKQYISPSVIDRFCKRYNDSERGFGFDMPIKKVGLAKDASDETFGHTGYTGTCVWVDPKSKIVFIFLSNRLYPSSKNYRLLGLKTRERLMQTVYDAMYEYNKQ